MMSPLIVPDFIFDKHSRDMFLAMSPKYQPWDNLKLRQAVGAESLDIDVLAGAWCFVAAAVLLVHGRPLAHVCLGDLFDAPLVSFDTIWRTATAYWAASCSAHHMSEVTCPTISSLLTFATRPMPWFGAFRISAYASHGVHMAGLGTAA